MKVLTVTLIGALVLALPNLGYTHTELAKAVPASGAELPASPPVIEIHFKSEARLTSVVAVGADKQERRLEFTVAKQPNTFNVTEPKLAAGRNEVQWKALSKDGHVASGKLIYTIKPTSKSN